MVRRPMRFAVRITRRAISPRLATRRDRNFTDGFLLFGKDVHVLADDAEHRLVRAAADRAKPPVAVSTRYRVVPGETHAAPVLQAGVRNLAPQPAAFQLRHRGEFSDVLARDVHLD